MTNSVRKFPTISLLSQLWSLGNKICGSLTRVALQELLSKGLLKLVSKYRAQVIYTRNTKGGDAPAAGEDAEQVPPTVHFEK